MAIRNVTCPCCGCRLKMTSAVVMPPMVKCPKCQGAFHALAQEDGPFSSAKLTSPTRQVAHPEPARPDEGPRTLRDRARVAEHDGPLLLAVSLAGLALVGGGVAAVVFWPESDNGMPGTTLVGARTTGLDHEMAANTHNKGTGMQPDSATVTSSISTGLRVFENNNCGSCHLTDEAASIGLVRGKGGKGPRMISLRGVGSRRGLEHLKEHIRYPKSHNPASRMPSYGEDRIPAHELQALADYLVSLK